MPKTDKKQKQTQAKSIEPKQPKKTGRPPGFVKEPTEKQLKIIAACSQIRMNIGEIADLCDVSRKTFYRWLKKLPHLSDIIKKARSQSKMHAVQSAYMRAFPQGKEYLRDKFGKAVLDKQGNPILVDAEGNTLLAIFLLKTMFGFKEPDKEIKVTGSRGDTELVFKVGDNNVNLDTLKQNMDKHYDKKGA